jgi:hypothetical protein
VLRSRHPEIREEHKSQMDSEMSDERGYAMDSIFSQFLSGYRHQRQYWGFRVAALFLTPLILATLALAQSGKTDTIPPQLTPVPPYLSFVSAWLHTEAENARIAQSVNQNTLDACRTLLNRARDAQNPAAIAAAQRAVNTAEEGLRKNQLREQRALKANAWVERLRQVQNSSTRVAGFMPRIEGTVEIQPSGGGAARQVTGDTPPVLGPGDTLRTGKDGYADILLGEGGLLSLDSGSALTLTEKGAEALYGEFRFWGKRKFEVRTPAAILAVRGTQFVFREIAGKPGSVVVIDGTVAYSDIKGTKTVLVGAGQQSYLLPDGMPAEPTKANLQEMKKWWEE